MKYIKMLGLLAVAAAALMALAGPASASTLTGPTSLATMKVGETIQATSTNVEIHGPFNTIECGHSLIQGEITQNGTKNATNAGAKITTLHFSNCNYNVTEAKVKGTFEINKAGEIIFNGTELAMHTSVGECVYGLSFTKVGTLTSGSPAKFDIAGSIPRTSGSFFCGSTGQWTGNYTVTSPSYLAVH